MQSENMNGQASDERVVRVAIGGTIRATPHTPYMTVADAFSAIGIQEVPKGTISVNEAAADKLTMLEPGDLVVVTPNIKNGL